MHLHRGRAGAGRGGEPDVVVFLPVHGALDATHEAQRVAELAEAGATHVLLLALDDDPLLEDLVAFVAKDLRPLVP